MDLGTQAKRRLLHAMTVVVGVASAITVAWPTWFESLTGSDRDGGDGSFERLVVRSFAIVALVALAALVVVGRRSRRTAVRLQGTRDHG